MPNDNNEHKLKSAEEWRDLWQQKSTELQSIDAGIEWHEQERVKFIKQIQLNAYKAGMTEAAEIACANPCDGLCFCPACKANKAILSARDKKGEL